MTLAVQTAECWEQSADAYVDMAEPFTGQFCIDAVKLARVEAGMTLLDVATGPGALALAAARAGAQVTAIDFAQAMIDRLAARIGDLPIEARRMDGQALALPDGSFDRACSVFGIPLFPDWRAGLRELARVTRAGGFVIVGTADNPFGFGPNRVIADARAECLPDRPAPPMVEAMAILADCARFEAELTAVGLVDVTIHERVHDFVLGSETFAAGARLIRDNPLLSDLTEADAELVVARAVARLNEQQQADVVHLPGTARIAVARKP